MENFAYMLFKFSLEKHHKIIKTWHLIKLWMTLKWSWKKHTKLKMEVSNSFVYFHWQVAWLEIVMRNKVWSSHQEPWKNIFNFGAKLREPNFQDTLMRYTTTPKKFGTLYPLWILFYYLAINVSFYFFCMTRKLCIIFWHWFVFFFQNITIFVVFPLKAFGIWFNILILLN
jgi:hypothetical protein